MVMVIGERTASVSIKELGIHCWLPRRFIKGHRCCRVQECSYPEKKTCKAVQAEVNYLRSRQDDLGRQIKELDGAIEELESLQK